MLLLAHTSTIFRNQALGTNGRQQMAQIASNVRCLCLPMSVTAAIQNGYSVGKAWTIYFEGTTDVKAGDRIQSNGLSFIVRGKKPYVGLAFVSHLEIGAETENANAV